MQIYTRRTLDKSKIPSRTTKIAILPNVGPARARLLTALFKKKRQDLDYDPSYLPDKPIDTGQPEP